MAVTKVRLSLAQYMALPEGNRPAELIDAELFIPASPSPRHQRIVLHLAQALDNHVRGASLGHVFAAPLDVILDAARPHVLQPDIAYISREREGIIGDRVNGAPDLVVEVLSPATANRDRTEKVQLYCQYGVRECWLVDPATETVEIRRLTPEGYETLGVLERGSALRSEVLPQLELSLQHIFES